MAALFMSNMGRMALPFYIIFGRQHFGLQDAHVGLLISAQIAGKIGGSFLWGLLGDLRGHSQAIKGVTLVSLIPSLLVLLSSFWTELPPLPLFVFLFFCIGAFLEGWPTFLNYMLAVTPEEKRSLYAGLMGIPQVPISLAPIIGGILVQNWGYISTFSAVASLTVVGFILTLLFLPREDRIN